MAKLPGLYAKDGSYYISFTTGVGVMAQNGSPKLQKGLYSPDGGYYTCKTNGNGNLK